MSSGSIRTSNGPVISTDTNSKINTNVQEESRNIFVSAKNQSNDTRKRSAVNSGNSNLGKNQNRKRKRGSPYLEGNNSIEIANGSSTGISESAKKKMKICAYCKATSFNKKNQLLQKRNTPYGSVCNACGIYWGKCVHRMTLPKAIKFFDWKIKNKLQSERNVALMDKYEELCLEEEDHEEAYNAEEYNEEEYNEEIFNAATILMNIYYKHHSFAANN